YNVKRSTNTGGPYSNISNPSGTSYTDTTAVNGTTYYYVVTAVGTGGESANSSQATATPQPPPAAPTALTPTPGNNQVLLNWTAPAGTVTSYNVKRATVSGGSYSTISTAGAVTGTAYTDTGLTNGTTYYYVVTAVNGSGESGNSNQAIATPQPPAPPAPTGLSPTAGDHQVILTWNASSGATGYNVYRGLGTGAESSTPVNASPITGGITTYTDSGLTN